MTTVTIRTDADTMETVEIRHERAADAFLINGMPFRTDDWAKIEKKDSALLPGMRATAWVCLDGKTETVLDWRPAP